MLGNEAQPPAAVRIHLDVDFEFEPEPLYLYLYLLKLRRCSASLVRRQSITVRKAPLQRRLAMFRAGL